jgi:hypothetical protein
MVLPSPFRRPAEEPGRKRVGLLRRSWLLLSDRAARCAQPVDQAVAKGAIGPIARPRGILRCAAGVHRLRRHRAAGVAGNAAAQRLARRDPRKGGWR